MSPLLRQPGYQAYLTRGFASPSRDELPILEKGVFLVRRIFSTRRAKRDDVELTAVQVSINREEVTKLFGVRIIDLREDQVSAPRRLGNAQS